ncbi:MAG: amiC 2 [Firmicutes bacterium]|nr:amiC 2 [Bacillota bacterium]
MRRAIGLLIFYAVIGTVFGSTTDVVLAAAQGGAKPSVAVATKRLAELTQVRWAIHTDAATGGSKIRIVVDVSDQVDASSEILSTPTPKLVITVKGARLGKVPKAIAMDGKIADGISIEADEEKNTRIVIDLPLMIDEDNVKVFTLRKDPVTKRPNRIVIDIDKPVPPVEFSFTPGLRNKVIVLDPGHGGSDPGAIGLNKTMEKDVTLAVAQIVKNLLVSEGAVVVMTRADDRDVFAPNATAVDELKARTTVGNSRKTDIFVSIHADSCPARSAGGTTAYYYQKTRYDALLAQNLESGMIDKGNLYERGAATANFYVIKRTMMPAALVELAFISNPDEEKLLVSNSFQQKIAQGIVDGMKNFFEQAANLGGAKR